ncbi:MAG TPA: sigma-70 family RNA polymerase sigma factor [Candidatus Binataceae bacterium]|nr:sigma-70 family RNA polymerase sigma factor [Candidatus Binataceae bacterium]
MARARAELKADGSQERLQVEAAQSDPSRFAELYEENFPRVYAYIARRVRERAEAEDLTADVFRRALENLGSYESRGAPFAAWLYRIAANAIVDRAARAARDNGYVAPDAEPEPLPEDLEYRARLFRMVDDLADDQRRVIVMRFAEQRSIAEIASAMRRSEGAIKQLQLRALHKLRNRIGESNG